MMANTTERYRRDAAFRELHKQRTRINYWRKRKLVRRPPTSVFQTEYYANITIANPKDTRCGNVIRVPVYRVGQYAALFSRGPQTIRQMIKSGRIPAPLFELDEGKRFGRAYTYDQMRVTMAFVLPRTSTA